MYLSCGFLCGQEAQAVITDDDRLLGMQAKATCNASWILLLHVAVSES